MGILQKLIRRLSDIAGLALAAMIGLTVADILMKNLLHQPITGAFESVELLLAIIVFFGLPEVFHSRSNIAVDVADHLVKPRLRAALKMFGDLSSLMFLLILGWAMLSPAWDTIVYPQNTQELGIPLFFYWLIILIGTAITIIATAAAGAFQGRRPIAGDEK